MFWLHNLPSNYLGKYTDIENPDTDKPGLWPVIVWYAGCRLRTFCLFFIKFRQVLRLSAHRAARHVTVLRFHWGMCGVGNLLWLKIYKFGHNVIKYNKILRHLSLYSDHTASTWPKEIEWQKDMICLYKMVYQNTISSTTNITIVKHITEFFHVYVK